MLQLNGPRDFSEIDYGWATLLGFLKCCGELSFCALTSLLLAVGTKSVQAFRPPNTSVGASQRCNAIVAADGSNSLSLHKKCCEMGI